MNQTINEEEAIKQYLLGRLSEEEQTPLEERLLTDDDFFERLKLAEDDLIDEYLANALPAEDRERFDNQFVTAPERKQKLRFSMAISKYVRAKRTPQSDSGGGSPEAVSPNPEADSPGSIRKNGGVKAKPKGHGTEFETPVPVLQGVPGPWARIASNPYLRMAASVIIVVSAGLGVYRLFFYQSDLDKGFAAFRGAYRKERPLEARVTALREYAPHIVTRGDHTGGVDEREVERAELQLREAERSHSDPASEHGLGEIYLAEKKFDRAVELLKKAIEAAPGNAQFHGDLGAALLEKGEFDRSAGLSGKDDELTGLGVEELAQSLEQFNKALELDPALLEALFNRAIMYERMNLPSQAEDDWHRYLERDANSEWAEEAREKLQRLSKKREKIARNKQQLLGDFCAAVQANDEEEEWAVFRQSRFRTGSLIAEVLMDEYLNLVAGGKRAVAANTLRALLHIADLDSRRGGDLFLSDLVRFYEKMPTAVLGSLVRARGSLRRGLNNYDQARILEALADYKEARHIFEAYGDTCEVICTEYLIGHCFLLDYRLRIGLSMMDRLASKCEAHRYWWLETQAVYAAATVQTSLNDYTLAIKGCNRGLRLCEQVGDPRSEAAVLQQLAQIYRILNNQHRSLSLIHRSMEISSAFASDDLQRWTDFLFAALSLVRIGQPQAAVESQKEALRLAMRIGRPQVVCRSYIVLGLIYGDLGYYDEGTKDARLALGFAERLPSDRARTESLAYVSLQLGHLYSRAREFGSAVTSYDRAIELYSEIRSPAFSYAAHKGRLVARIALGDEGSVEGEIDETLALFELYRSKIAEQSNRDSFFDAEQSICDIAIDFALSKRKDPRKAFDYSEKCRARSLLDLVNAGAGAGGSGDVLLTSSFEPMDIEGIRQRLPGQIQIVQYAVLDEKVIAWVVSKNGFYEREEKVPIKDLKERVGRYVGRLSSVYESDSVEAVSDAKALFDILIRPIEGFLDKSRQVCVVPDKFLDPLPFGALISSLSGKYLLQDYVLLSSPSANMVAISTDNAYARREASPEALLSVGNPTFDRRKFPSLEDLPAASSEAESVAAFYSGAKVLLAEDATKERVERGMEVADVIHIAAHSVINYASSMQSGIVLAAGAQSPSGNLLRADEICRLSLPRTRLVVLSACASGSGQYYGGEGMMGIARSFLAARVPVVIASMWPVGSDATAILMIRFHLDRKTRRVPVAMALRDAQLEMIGSGRRGSAPYFWASFIVFGGYTEY